jgi:beta-mannanase
MISWEPWQGLEPIVRGDWDAYLAAYARAVAGYGQPLFLRFAHEMNLPQIPWFGPPQTFIAAWQRVRSAFDHAGANNVRWVWSPYCNGRSVADLQHYFPGRALVDWPALDGYNWGRRSRWWRGGRWPSFETIFAPSLRAVTGLAPGTPVMLAEIGCAERGGDKSAWMRDALLNALPERHPEVRAVVWFNENRPEHADWRVDSSPSSLRVWREAVADPRYGLTDADLVAISSPR